MGSDQKKGSKTSTGKNQGGRPVLPDEVRRERLLRLLCTDAEYVELQEAASYVSMPVSTWVRSIALEKARAIALEKARHGGSPRS
jgi:hypothetical protein